MFSLDAATIQTQRRFNNPLFVHGIGAAAVIFFGLAGILFIRKLFDKKPGLVFSRVGILDNSSAVSAGVIPWSEIVGAELFQIHRQKLLVIKVKTPERYIEQGNPLKRALNRANHSMMGSPIAVSSNALQIGFAQLVALFHEYHEQFGTVGTASRS